MANPKRISAYDPTLIACVEEVATTQSKLELTFEFETPAEATTFSSRFYTLRRLLEDRATKNNDPKLASQLGAIGLRAAQYEDALAPGKQKRRVLAWTITNRMGNSSVVEQSRKHLAAIAAMRHQQEAPTQKQETPKQYNYTAEGSKPFNPYLIDNDDNDE